MNLDRNRMMSGFLKLKSAQLARAVKILEYVILFSLIAFFAQSVFLFFHMLSNNPYPLLVVLVSLISSIFSIWLLATIRSLIQFTLLNLNEQYAIDNQKELKGLYRKSPKPDAYQIIKEQVVVEQEAESNEDSSESEE